MLSLILVCFLAQSVSDQLEQRTGYRLPDSVQEGPPAFTLPPGVRLTGQLSARDAVAIALWNNTALQADLAALEISRADLVEARLFRNPSFSALLPVGPKPFEFLLAWPLEELWQRGRRVKAAELNISAVGTGLVQNGLNLIRDVRVAHTDLWLAQERSQSLQESAAQRARIAVLTERRRDAGDASGLEVRLAQVDARSTSEFADRAVNEVEVVRARLRQLLGMRGDRRPFAAVLEEAGSPVPPLPALLEIAMSNRPDLRAAELDVETNAERARWQRSRVLAMLAPALSVKDVGTAGIRSGPGLNADIPALNRNQGQISRTDAEVLRSGRLYASLRDRVEQDVIDAYERISQAQASLAMLRQQVRPAVDEAVQLTERAYQNGDVSLLNVLEATRQRFDVVLREIDAQATLQRARGNQPGHEIEHPMAIVILGGLLTSTVLNLFVMPVLYQTVGAVHDRAQSATVRE